MMMSEIAIAAMEPFWSSELEYRRERAHREYVRGGRRRFRIRRRPTLKAPAQGRRPLAVA